MEEFKKGWGALLAATIGTMCGLLTITVYTQGFFVGPVTSEFGWSPPQFFFGFTVMMCMGFFCGPLIGSIAAKQGLKKIGIIGLIGHCASYFLISFNTGSPVMWYISFALLAVLGAGSLPIIWTAVLNDWFFKHRGKAIGITMMGTGIGAFILPPIADYVISNYGWRMGYRALGLGALLLSLPIVIVFFKRNLEEASAHVTQTVASWGLTRAEALKTRKFWILSIVLFISVFVVVGFLSNFKLIMVSKGIDESDVPWLASIMGLSVILGRISVGILVDRYWAPAVAAVFFSFPIIAILLLLNLPTSINVAIIFAFTVGLATGAELDFLAYMTSRYFGTKYYSEVFGCVYAFFTVGSGLSPTLSSSIAQSVGYDGLLTFFVWALIATVILFLTLGRYPEIQTHEAAEPDEPEKELTAQ